MKDGPKIAQVAAVIGDPGRANMLVELLDGQALTASELAIAAGVAAPTASGHLAKLVEAHMIVVERQGRHRYFRLADPHVAEVLEGLMGLAQRTGAVRRRPGPREPALRAARVCYDHLAGERAVALAQSLEGRGLVSLGAKAQVTAAGRAFFDGLGFDLVRLERSRRPLCRACLDWSERKSHLAGSLGAAILGRVIDAGWASRAEGRVVAFTPAGAAAFDRAFGLV
ncbi:MAG TPA: helix-turn-helix transcriptional regulator [Caulobacteraceae bacterium]|jgi:DNA-binding transcriptional ArsR family regulator